MTRSGAMAAKGKSIRTSDRIARRRQQRMTTDGRLAGYVEILPGVWQPAGMAAADRWKRQQLRREKP
jgi:hypothetical protein